MRKPGGKLLVEGFGPNQPIPVTNFLAKLEYSKNFFTMASSSTTLPGCWSAKLGTKSLCLGVTRCPGIGLDTFAYI